MALAGTYDADGDFVEAYPEDQRKIIYIKLVIFFRIIPFTDEFKSFDRGNY